MFCFLVYHTSNIIHSIGPRWTPLSLKLNASTFIIENRNFWFGSYWEIGNNIFHHDRLFFFVVWSCEERIKMLTIGKSVRGILLRSIFLRRFYRPIALQIYEKEMFYFLSDVIISQMNDWFDLIRFDSFDSLGLA